MKEDASISVVRLPWDSAFFGFSVGRLMLPSGAVDAEIVKAAIRDENCELTYVFLPVGGDASRASERARSALVELGGKCCDLKVTYRKALSEADQLRVGNVSVAVSATSKLEDLALASGWCSRFVSDDRLRPFFRSMYLRWLKRDMESGRVFVLPTVDAPEGIVTVSIYGGIGKIGLVAVDANSCGKGLATLLMRHVCGWLAGQGIRECEVVTQGLNVAARHLYEKVGFKLQTQMEVWHIWKKRAGENGAI